MGCFLAASMPPLGGCSVSMPMGSMLPEGDDVTASLAEVPFGQLLDQEDRRRAKAALATALDPQGDGATIQWENPKTHHKGTITPVGNAYAADTKMCRAFLAELQHDGAKRAMKGTACVASAGEWALRDVRPPKA